MLLFHEWKLNYLFKNAKLSITNSDLEMILFLYSIYSHCFMKRFNLYEANAFFKKVLWELFT